MIEKILKYKLKAAKPIILEKTENRFNSQIEEARNSYCSDEEKRRERVVALAKKTNSSRNK